MRCAEIFLDEPADIPVIDFRQLNGTPEERKVALGDLDNAFQSVGFVYLSNHSIPQHTIDEAFAWSQRFFALPHNIKKRIAHPPSGALKDHRGFLEVGQVLVSQLIWDVTELVELRKTTPERHESLEIGNPYDTRDDVPPNRWLSEDDFPGFRTFYESWWDSCVRLEHELLRNVAEALKLPDEEHLTKQHSRDFAHMSMNYYPSMAVEPLQSRQVHRMNAHTDFQQLTMLFNDGVGGLEVHDGQAFRPVIPKPGTIILNVGDMLERQTNGRWKSGLHQVVAPRESMISSMKAVTQLNDISVIDRRSIAFFGMADPDYLVETLPGCEKKGRWTPNMTEGWGPVETAGQWLAKRVETEFPSAKQN